MLIGAFISLDWAIDGHIAKAAFSLISDVAVTLYFCLQGCFFIGPGEFAKRKQEKLSGQEQFSNSKS